jgi:dethiobiotin synthetase
MLKYFITGTGTDVGKTYVARLLCRQYGYKAIKPVSSGSGDDCELLGCKPKWLFKAPVSPNIAAAREGLVVDFNELVQYCQNSGADIIEGAGGVMTPLTANKTNLDLIKALNLPAILVTTNHLGCISHTLTALKAMEGIETKVIINEVVQGETTTDELVRTIKEFSGLQPKMLECNGKILDFKCIDKTHTL